MLSLFATNTRSELAGCPKEYPCPINSPVFGPDGEVQYIIHRVEDVTEFVRLSKATAAKDQLPAELKQRVEKAEAEMELAELHARVDNLVARKVAEEALLVAQRLRDEPRQRLVPQLLLSSSLTSYQRFMK